jgi:ring-1,2-phenylacetyl-CoA epoxidase subunit PaaE
MSRFFTLTIRDVRREAADAVSLALVPAEGDAAAFTFTPGQYLTLRATLGGEEVRRSYSIASGVEDGELRIGVRHVPGGAMSGYLNEAVRPGDTIEVMPPQGRFGRSPEPEAAHRYLAIAAGSGITPVLGIVRSVLVREPKSEAMLIYGNRNAGSVMFAETIEAMKNRHLDRFAVTHILSREAQDVPLLSGRIDAAKIAALAETILDLPRLDAAYLCGPREMMRVAKATLIERGMPATKVFTELFAAPQADGAPRAKKIPAAVAAASPLVARVAVVLDGRSQAFDLRADDSSLITAAARQGLDLPHSCTGGMCSTCRCRLVAGKVEMAVNYALEPWELERGFVLACQARPTTPTITLDFDQM